MKRVEKEGFGGIKEIFFFCVQRVKDKIEMILRKKVYQNLDCIKNKIKDMIFIFFC